MVPKGSAHLLSFDVVSNERVADGIYKLVIHAQGIASGLEPGQFVNLAVPGDPAQILRIPLSFSRVDEAADAIEIEYALVGDGTRRLAAMAPGSTSTVVSPCGHPWKTGSCGGRAVLVAGGIGVTPIVGCARSLAAAGVQFDAVVGAQTADRLWGVDELSALGAGRVLVTTDDGTAGMRGFTTDALSKLLAGEKYDTVFTCGPEVMMRGVAAIAHESGLACQVSMERMMSCGFGACGTCNVAMRAGGYASACMDGPVFDAGEVAW